MAFTDDDLLASIRGGESDRVEFTESTRDLDKFREAICAFANDLPDHRKPGLLFVGLRDDATCAGLTVDDALLTKLAGLRGDGAILPLPSMTVEKRNLDGCDVAVVQVLPSDNPPVRAGGRCWIRIGPRRGQATAEEERRLTEKRRHWINRPFDMHGVVGATVENDLDMRRFQTEYLPNAVAPEVLAENARQVQERLLSLRLITVDGTPTVAAILMLGKFPGHWLPGAYVQFARFDGEKITDPILSEQQMHGTLPDQLDALDKMLVANIRTALDTGGARHVEKPDYPIAALRELAYNAVIHRNYEGTGAPVRVYWYTDRIEIASPGSVYGSVTPENFGSGVTDYRNQAVAGMMKELGFMQQFGRGIMRAQKALLDNGNPKAQFDIEPTTILATVRRK